MYVYVEFDVCVGHGSQDLMTKAIEMLINPAEDTLLIESPTYVGILAFLRPFGVGLQEVSMDAEGISADELDRVLDNWESTHPSTKKKPRVLYTVATASNPTGIIFNSINSTSLLTLWSSLKSKGITTSQKRKQKVYEIAQKHNLIILEDDPYYYLQYPSSTTPTTKDHLTEHLTPSYFSMDTDGRVLRFDSFSKILSAGARLGFISGPPFLIDRLQMHQQSTILSPSGISQLLITAYLEKKGIDGFLAHCGGPKVAGLYQARRDLFMQILEKWLGCKGITWTIPSAGMFTWIDLSGAGVADSFHLVSQKCVDAGVTLVPGQEFYADNRVTGFVRASFSFASHEDMELGIQRLAGLLSK